MDTSFIADTGPFALEPLAELAEKVDDYCKSTECGAVLVDISKASGEMDDFNIFEQGKTTFKLMRSRTKLAVLEKRPTKG